MPRTPSGLDVIEEDVVEVQSYVRRRFKMVVFSVMWYGGIIYMGISSLYRGIVDHHDDLYLRISVFFCLYIILICSIIMHSIIVHDRVDFARERARQCLADCVKARVEIMLGVVYYTCITALFVYVLSSEPSESSEWVFASCCAYILGLALPMGVYMYRMRVRSRVREIVEADMA